MYLQIWYDSFSAEKQQLNFNTTELLGTVDKKLSDYSQSYFILNLIVIAIISHQTKLTKMSSQQAYHFFITRYVELFSIMTCIFIPFLNDKAGAYQKLWFGCLFLKAIKCLARSF